jgi:hypothetical protein
MKKLDDIPKKQIFEVPDGYFDSLPTRIQARITERKSAHGFSLSAFTWKYAIPVVMLTAVGIFLFTKTNNAITSDADTLLANVETADLIIYLEESDLSTDDMLAEIYFDNDDATDIEEAVYETHFDGATEDELLEELDLNSI